MQQGKDGAALFDVPLAPENAGAEATWQIMPAGTSADRPWLMEFDKQPAMVGENRVAYVRTRVWSPAEQKAQLELGSDDGVKAWLNGQVVHANNATRPASPGQDKAEVTLKEGWNALMLKITQGGGEWVFCARLRDADGNKLEGLKVEPQ